MANLDPRLKAVWDDLDRQERALKLEQKHLSEIWLQVCEKHKQNAKARAELDAKKLKAGLSFVEPATPVRLNVGGQEFETTAGVLCRDEFSVLAGLCRGRGDSFDPRLERDFAGLTAGCFFIDRDWWVFRHVLQFLRTGVLPEDPLLVEELYSEATFYRLAILKQAVERRAASFHIRARGAATRPAAPDVDCGCGGVCCGGGGGGGGHAPSARLRGSDSWPKADMLPDPFGFSATAASRTRR